ncbi:dihydroxyacetone kinase subunit DhaL [Jeotgalibacillus soli]|uniref:phosphoenolpyruvate--glycerone phosphotransferase n=1 Tax=Jeotgalibacillus soli TaxID=889306 RepID=A0A0C2VY95_9BACL|nr:dihydroxyacetone kinase subunit DhaL [Jeotgalibacillus soli]KIL49391.1 hypothetical protein KP78_08590 [Jeotgalibacillus soli]
MNLTTQETIQWIERANSVFQEKKDELTELDQVIGDGDHGINMARGFQAAAEKLQAGSYATPSDALKDAAMTLLSKIGGASGPLYGSAFLKLSSSTKGAETISFDQFKEAMSEATDSLKMRGKAEESDKTMIDVWGPFTAYLQVQSDVQPDEWIEKLADAKEKTKDMQANKGRAAYYKEKSVGHMDAGAASTYYLFAALAEILKERGE